MKKMILGIVWQLMGFLGSIIILCSAAPYQWDYNGITGILGSLLGLDLIIPLIICIIFFIDFIDGNRLITSYKPL